MAAGASETDQLLNTRSGRVSVSYVSAGVVLSVYGGYVIGARRSASQRGVSDPHIMSRALLDCREILAGSRDIHRETNTDTLSLICISMET